MDYMILDDAGNALASFDDEVTAHASLHAMVAIEPAAADHVRLLAYTDEGMPVGEALAVWDVPLPVTVCESAFLQPHYTKTLVRLPSGAYTRYFGATWVGPVVHDDPVTA